VSRLSTFTVYIAVEVFLTFEPKTFGQKPSDVTVGASTNSEKKSGAERLRDELLRMGEQDQLHRTELQAKAIEMSKAGTTVPSETLLVLQKKQDEIDKRNLERLERIVMLHGWPGKSLVGEQAAGREVIADKPRFRGRVTGSSHLHWNQKRSAALTSGRSADREQ
jgi:hypothetical protein